MKIDKNNIYVNIIFISIFLIFLDAYEVFSVPISWIGLSLLLIPALLEGKAISNSGNIKIIYIFSILISIPQIVFLVNNEINSSYNLYIFLRYLNIFSFIFLFYFSLYFFNTKNINLAMLGINRFIIFFSVITIYIFVAQIFDLYEPFRNRANTDIAEMTQATFWLSQPHRAMSTFREPVIFVTFFFPLVLIYLKYNNNKNYLIAVMSGFALGLSKSDLLRVIGLLIVFYLLLNYLSTKEIKISFVFLILSMFTSSTLGLLECNLNPNSIECSKFDEDVKKINDSGEIKIKINSSNPVNLDNDRLSSIRFFLDTLPNLNPEGIGIVNIKFNDYMNERLQESQLSTENMRNVQNLIIFYTLGFGFVFPVTVFLLYLNLLFSKVRDFDLLFFLILSIFLFISPIEELNAYFGLILGLSFILFTKNKNESYI
ncbi:hypothetical protein OA181_03065 [Acidimicrobiaceae bacterium]|nr:hypothetical protein [Acidimicrobiaceae bacterium]